MFICWYKQTCSLGINIFLVWNPVFHCHLSKWEPLKGLSPLKKFNRFSLAHRAVHVVIYLYIILCFTCGNMSLCTNLFSNETGSRSPCMRPRSNPTKMKNSTLTILPHFNFSITAELNDVTSRLIILINKEINEANWMVSNSAKLDRRTKQHTQFEVSASNDSRDMARTKSWRKKKK